MIIIIIIVMVIVLIVIPVGHGGIVISTVLDQISFLKETAAFELMQVSRGVFEKAPK